MQRNHIPVKNYLTQSFLKIGQIKMCFSVVMKIISKSIVTNLVMIAQMYIQFNKLMTFYASLRVVFHL